MKAADVYAGSDGTLTKAYYAELASLGPLGAIAMNLFRAQKCSSRAKLYRGGLRGRGSFRSMAYDRKSWSMRELVAILAARGSELGISFGWKKDPKTKFGEGDSWVLYVDLPGGQVSFHSPERFAGPDYGGDWDGEHKSEERILEFCEWVRRRPDPRQLDFLAVDALAS